MKDFVIGVNNIVLYIALAVILIVSLFMMSQSFLSGLGMFVGGTGLVHRLRLLVRAIGNL